MCETLSCQFCFAAPCKHLLLLLLSVSPLQAYSVYDEEIGYCQGQSFLAAVLLLHVSTYQRRPTLPSPRTIRRSVKQCRSLVGLCR